MKQSRVTLLIGLIVFVVVIIVLAFFMPAYPNKVIAPGDPGYRLPECGRYGHMPQPGRQYCL